MADRPPAEASDAPATAPAVAGASAASKDGSTATVTEEKADVAAEEQTEGSVATTSDENESAADTPAEEAADTPAEENESSPATAEAEAAYAAAEHALAAAADALNAAKSGSQTSDNGSSPATVKAAAAAAPGKTAKAPVFVPPKRPRAKRTPFWKLPFRQQLWIAGGVIAVVALVIAGIFTWQATTTGEKILTQVAGTSMAKDPSNPNLIDFNDPGTKFKLSFPAAWTTRAIGGSDVRLVAGPGNGDLMSVRVDTLDTGSQAPTQDNLLPYLNAIVEGTGVNIMTRDKIQMGNLPGWYFVYTFTDSSSKQVGLHAQYFMIRGSQLYSIVFQALPLADFHKLATTYQQVANSIKFY